MDEDIFAGSLVERAIRIAAVAHRDQVRKSEDIPYIIHPMMVALKLQKYDFGDEVIAAALCHDVLEDTTFSASELQEELGDEVVEIVRTVTHDDSLPWMEQKQKYIEQVRNGSVGAKAVCAADKIHNAESKLITFELKGSIAWEKFGNRDQRLWFDEAVLAMLKETWDHPLINELEKLVAQEKLL